MRLFFTGSKPAPGKRAFFRPGNAKTVPGEKLFCRAHLSGPERSGLRRLRDAASSGIPLSRYAQAEYHDIQYNH
jgi:hypothetical protein